MITPTLRNDHPERAAFLDQHAKDCAEVESIAQGYPLLCSNLGDGPIQQALKLMAQAIANDPNACRGFESDFTFHDQACIREEKATSYLWATRRCGTSLLLGIKGDSATHSLTEWVRIFERGSHSGQEATRQWYHVHIGSVASAVTPLTFEQTLDVARRIDNVQV